MKNENQKNETEVFVFLEEDDNFVTIDEFQNLDDVIMIDMSQDFADMTVDTTDVGSFVSLDDNLIVSDFTMDDYMADIPDVDLFDDISIL